MGHRRCKLCHASERALAVWALVKALVFFFLIPSYHCIFLSADKSSTATVNLKLRAASKPVLVSYYVAYI